MTSISLSPAQTISALGAIVSATPLAHVRKTCSSLLTKQLLRPHGIQGLLDVMFGEEDSLDDRARLEKQEHIARILMTIPANIKATVSNASLSSFFFLQLRIHHEFVGVFFTYFPSSDSSSFNQYSSEP